MKKIFCFAATLGFFIRILQVPSLAQTPDDPLPNNNTPAANNSTKTPIQQEIEKRFPPYVVGFQPDWLKNRAGIEALDSSVVLKPWTPVKATNSQVEVWNRKYQIGDWGLPRQVEIGGADFLAAPIPISCSVSCAQQFVSIRPPTSAPPYNHAIQTNERYPQFPQIAPNNYSTSCQRPLNHILSYLWCLTQR